MITRRTFLERSALSIAGLYSTSALAADASSSTEAATGSGRLRGKLADGVVVFRGVPFAQPPIGPLRFRPAVPAKPWAGVRDATAFAPDAVQEMKENGTQAEDCLYLNLWTPVDAKNLPVLVWVHGGGFLTGSASDPNLNGARFAQDGVICITISYRLGVLGFMDLGPMLGESYSGSANNGIGDIVAALKWVQANVHAFGGDPARVTVGGQSAGGKLVDLLMGIPSAEPLFQQMISESGGADRIWTRDVALNVSKAFASIWTKETGLPVTGIQTASVKQILAAQEQFLRICAIHFPFRADIDGALIPEHPLLAIRKNSCRGKRLLIGNNRDESATFVGPHPDRDPTQKDLGNILLQQFDPVFDGYKKMFPGVSMDRLRLQSLTAEEYWVPSMRVAQAHVGAGNEAFVYRLDFPDPVGRFVGLVPHSAELRFVWGKTNSFSESAARRLAVSVHGAWIAFIKGEVPNAEGLPVWTPYSTTSQQTMVFDAKCHMEQGPQAAELALWDGLLES